MYIRTIKRKNKDGSVVEYVQLAHNVRHPQKGYPKAEVIHSFGRRDRLDVDAMKRLVTSISRFFEPEDGHALKGDPSLSGHARFVRSRAAGGAYLLRTLWERLGMGACLNDLLGQKSATVSIEPALFASVAHRALARPFSAPLNQWATEDVFLGREASIQAPDLSGAVDILIEHADTIQKTAFHSAANMLNLTVDRIFFDTFGAVCAIDEIEPWSLTTDTTSCYACVDWPRETIGLAVTREGIPVKCWLPNTSQRNTNRVDPVPPALEGWEPDHLVWVVDRKRASDTNRWEVKVPYGRQILGETLGANPIAGEILSRKGRFKALDTNLLIKEGVIGEGAHRRRYVITFDPQQAEADRRRREKILDRLRFELETINTAHETGARHEKRLPRSMGRFVKELNSGKLKIDNAAVRKEEKHDGKYLLITNDRHLSSEDVARCHRQLQEAKRTFHQMNHPSSLFPAHRSRTDRIHSHIMLAWLALLLTRIAEVSTGMPWPAIRREMQRLQLGDYIGPIGPARQYTEPTRQQNHILRELNIPHPGRF
jgi:hypothetical protein